MPSVGHYILSLALVVFAYTTILGWSYYGGALLGYLAGTGRSCRSGSSGPWRFRSAP